MTPTEFLEKFAPLTSEMSRESAAIEVFTHFPDKDRGPVWWVSVRRPASDYGDEEKIRRIATFDVEDGQMVNVEPLGDAAVRDWERVRKALACGTDYMAGQICMLPSGHEGEHR